jgi:hypothetical protein
MGAYPKVRDQGHRASQQKRVAQVWSGSNSVFDGLRRNVFAPNSDQIADVGRLQFGATTPLIHRVHLANLLLAIAHREARPWRSA